MAVSQADRTRIYTGLAAATSPETTEIFMHQVFDVQWDDLVTKTHLAALRCEFAGLRGEFADLRVEMHRSFNAQTTRMISAMIALSGVIVAAIHFA